MQLPLKLLLLGLPLTLVSPIFAQKPENPAPLPSTVAAMVDGRPISQSSYRDFLFHRYGKRPLSQLVDQIVVQNAAKLYGIQITEEAMAGPLAKRLKDAHQGRPEAQFFLTLRDSGMDFAMFEHNLRQDLRQELTLDALVHATRVPTDTRIAKAFKAKYGEGGVQVQIRHILVMPHFIRAEKLKAGVSPQNLDNEQIKLEARQRAEECHRRLDAGEDFVSLVQEYSNDQVTLRSNGMLPVYRPGLYGAAFTQAVASLQPGAYSAVLESGAGFHVVQLVSRQVTQLEDVRASLVEEVMSAAPTWQDREEVLSTLRAAADIQLW